MGVGSAAEGAPRGVEGALPSHLVLFDGVCAFCDISVRWLLAHDRRGLFRYAPLQGETAAALRARHPEIPSELDTVAVVEREEGRECVYLRSAAVFRILARLDPPWRWLAALGRLPRPLTDLGYRLFARLRYRVFGTLDACRVPSAAERARFLD